MSDVCGNTSRMLRPGVRFDKAFALRLEAGGRRIGGNNSPCSVRYTNSASIRRDHTSFKLYDVPASKSPSFYRLYDVRMPLIAIIKHGLSDFYGLVSSHRRLGQDDYGKHSRSLVQI